MMDQMMGGAMMWGMGLIGLLLIIVLVLAVARPRPQDQHSIRSLSFSSGTIKDPVMHESGRRGRASW